MNCRSSQRGTTILEPTSTTPPTPAIGPQPECSPPTRLCPHPENWRMYDGETAELEVLAFLGSMVRLLKPSIVVETGSAYGYSALNMGQVLRLNADRYNSPGHLFSYEADPVRAREAMGRCEGLPVSILNCHTLEPEPITWGVGPIDLLYLDSDLGARVRELKLFRENLSPRHVILLHDTGETHASPRQQLEEYRAEHQLQVVNLAT